MGAKTISFPKGKGSIRHNNREFISSNVDRSRTHMNVYFIQEPLEAAYQKCFGQALADYNAKQKRKDNIVIYLVHKYPMKKVHHYQPGLL